MNAIVVSSCVSKGGFETVECFFDFSVEADGCFPVALEVSQIFDVVDFAICLDWVSSEVGLSADVLAESFHGVWNFIGQPWILDTVLEAEAE